MYTVVVHLHPARKIPGYPAGIPAAGILVCRVEQCLNTCGYYNTRGYLTNGYPFGYPRVNPGGFVEQPQHIIPPQHLYNTCYNKMGTDGI